MSFKEVIEKNTTISAVNWWPKYAYHFTDVSNAVSILKSGKLYSRINANMIDVMSNDNASSQVLDFTNAFVKSYVRFYFRPLTPTQYYNEGYKHKQLRFNDDENANTPVPIFFVFDLNKLLSDPKTCFSGSTQAGKGAVVYNSEEDFLKLDFATIYSKGQTDVADETTKKIRQAEILYPGEYSIKDALVAVVCRNEPERATLLNMLNEVDEGGTFNRYKSYVMVSRGDMFYNNAFFIKDVSYNSGSVRILFNDSYSKDKYARNENKIEKQLPGLKTLITLSWFTSSKDELYSKSAAVDLSYNQKEILLNLETKIPGAKRIEIKFEIEGKIIGYYKYNLAESEII